MNKVKEKLEVELQTTIANIKSEQMAIENNRLNKLRYEESLAKYNEYREELENALVKLS